MLDRTSILSVPLTASLREALSRKFADRLKRVFSFAKMKLVSFVPSSLGQIL